MAETAPDVLIEDIMDWGVDHVFGFPGEWINGIMESLRKRQDRIKSVQVRHEEAAFMATAYAKYTGKLGCCLATSGPGAVHLLNGLYDAAMDSTPVLALTGMTYHDLVGTHYQQDVNTQALFSDVATFNERVMGPAHVPNLAHPACRTALSSRGVAHITFPTDLQEKEFDGLHSKADFPRHTSTFFQPMRRAAKEEAVRAAAEILNQGKKIAINGLRSALERAVASGRPAAVEVEADPNEPCMPAQANPEQAQKFAVSLLHGQPNRERIAVTLFRDKVHEVTH